ncbi:MAG: ComEC/Rec2 family competence protein, partial [bacterium]
RATVMAVVFIVSSLIRREPDISNAICVAALFILILNPRQLFDVGFQLSFVSVISIIFLYPKLRQFVGMRHLKAKPLRFILEGFLVSLAAWAGTAGLIAYYFKIFSPVTVLANILVVPLASLITLSGTSLIAVGLACPILAPLFARANEALIWVMVMINALMLQIPGASLRLT